MADNWYLLAEKGLTRKEKKKREEKKESDKKSPVAELQFNSEI